MNFLPGISDPDEALLRANQIFPNGVAIGLAFPWDDPGDLLPEESDCLPGAIDKRLREFASGRRAARSAIEQLGHKGGPILHQSDRSPRWPTGLSGSISHTDTICLAAVARSKEFSSLGLDIEKDTDLPEDMMRYICTSSELAWLSFMPSQDRGRLAKLIFSAKECAYKLQYPITRHILDFQAFEITLDPETHQFEATFTKDVDPFPARTQFSGRFDFVANLVMTGLALPRTMLPD